MFRSHVTRPLRWAIPLAVIGGIAAAVWFLRPLEIEIDGERFRCGDIGGVFCDDERRERFLITGLILLVAGLPLLIVAIRGLIWAADTLDDLHREVRRLRERLDSDD